MGGFTYGFLRSRTSEISVSPCKKLALDDISFTAEKGEFIGIIGENGAGKSTLSQAFCGLVPQFYKGAYGGKVTIDGILAATTPTAELCKKSD